MSRDITERLPDGLLGKILAELKSIREEQAQVKTRLTSVEEKIDERQLETKPNWERALAEISEARNEMQKLATDFREVKRNVRGLNDSLLNIVGELREMDGIWRDWNPRLEPTSTHKGSSPLDCVHQSGRS